MKYFPRFFIAIILTQALSAQDVQKPEWVKLFQSGMNIPDTLDCYMGIGASSLSQADADAKARQEFALAIESCVQNVISHNVVETDGVLNEEYSASAKVSTDIVLRGVNVSNRYDDKDLKQFYSLIQIQKTVFDTLFVSEVRRDLERKRAENKVNEEKRAEELRSRQAALDMNRKEEETKQQELELEKKKYGEFLSLAPPEQVIDLPNGEIARKGCTLALRTALAPFDIQSAYLKFALWPFEFSANGYFEFGKFLDNDMLRREQASLKVQLLDQAGRFYKTSLAFGVVGYANAARFSEFDTLEPEYSVFVAGDISLPTALYSYASAYVDGRKISFGLNSFPFPGYFKDAVSLLVQVDYVWNNEWKDRFFDPLLLQAGVRFRTSDAFATSFTYEGHEFLVFTIEMGF